MNNILVFGAAGFMGGYLVNALKSNGCQVYASDIDEESCQYEDIPFFKIDITRQADFELLKDLSFDAVIHLAAIQPANVSKNDYDPKEYIRVNVIGTLNILDFCRNAQVKKIIYASSHRNTQALWVNDKPVSESDGRAIKYSGEYSMFSISESAAQDCVEHYHAAYDLNTIIFRLPPVYGYGPHTEIFKEGKPIKTGFQIFIEKAMACEPLEIWGDSSRGRDIVYIKDVIAAFIKAIESKTAQGLYNITSGKKLTLREEAETIASVFWGNDSTPVIIERPEIENSIDSFVYDISKAKEELNWSPQYSFREMLEDYIKEGNANQYGYLLEKRKRMLAVE